jgi:hypothetical protein
VTARFELEPGASYPLAQHRPGILLIDDGATEAIPLDYHANISSTANAQGDLQATTLRIPAGTRLAKELSAIVLLDVFPAAQHRLGSEKGLTPLGP